MSHPRSLAVLAAIAAGALAASAPAMAQTVNDYPPAAAPGAPQKAPKGPSKTRYVCAKNEKKRCYKTIQKAVNAAKAGDTVIVPDGTYKEAVLVTGPSKRYLKIRGNFEDPERVVMDGGNAKRQNAIFVDGADNVEIGGFSAKDYGANGFFVRNVVGYTMHDLVATHTGKYGLYAFNSIGGTIRDSTASETNDGAYYIGQTPPQAKPVRTLVTNVVGFANVLGFSAENMRYVTITKSRFYNNAIGIAFSSQDGEKYAPPQDNAVVKNEIFWNNFNYYKGAPFAINKKTPVPYPPGIGIVLFGGQRTQISDNDIYGNWVAGISSLQGFLSTKVKGGDTLIGNEVKGNRFGLAGTDLNGRDLLADGNGSGNCWGPNEGVQNVFPDLASFPACPFTGANAFSKPAQDQMLQWLVAPDHESPYIRHPHAPKKGYTPLETYTK